MSDNQQPDFYEQPESIQPLESADNILNELAGTPVTTQNWIEEFIEDAVVTGNVDTTVIEKHGDEIAVYIHNNKERLTQQKTREFINALEKVKALATATRRFDRQLNLPILLATNPTLDEIHWILKKIATSEAPDAFASRDSINKVLALSLRYPEKISSPLAIWAFVNYVEKTDPLEVENTIINMVYKNRIRELNHKEFETLCLALTTAKNSGEAILRMMIDEAQERGNSDRYMSAKSAYSKYISRAMLQPDTKEGNHSYAIFLKAESGDVRHYILVDEDGKVRTKSVPELPFNRSEYGGRQLDLADMFLQNKGLPHKAIIEMLGMRIAPEDVPPELLSTT